MKAAPHYFRLTSHRSSFAGFETQANGKLLVTLKSGETLLAKKGIAESALRGAYISVETVLSTHDRVILIGDAGGFANKLSYEGLYYAIATAETAYKAIVEDKRYIILNRDIFRKKRREVYLTRLFYSPFGLWLVRLGSHSPRLIKKNFQRYM